MLNLGLCFVCYSFFFFVFHFVDEVSIDLLGSVNTENGQILSGSLHNSNLFAGMNYFSQRDIFYFDWLIDWLFISERERGKEGEHTCEARRGRGREERTPSTLHAECAPSVGLNPMTLGQDLSENQEPDTPLTMPPRHPQRDIF